MAYQAYAAYNSAHYPQAAYPHFAQYTPAPQATPTPAPAMNTAATLAAASTPSTMPSAAATLSVSKPATPAAAAASVAQVNGQDANMDISTLNDALGSAGVDLKVRFDNLISSLIIVLIYIIERT